MSWFQLGAAKNDANSQLKLGIMYKHGKGAPRNYELAIE
jgi:TPR repeat protein